MDWRTLSDIGQAFGTVSAVISAVALAGVVNSLRLQRKQTHVSAHDTARSLRMQLVLFAMQNPKYLPIWGFPMQGGQDEASEFAYTSLVFSQLKTRSCLACSTKPSSTTAVVRRFATVAVSISGAGPEMSTLLITRSWGAIRRDRRSAFPGGRR